ncbi:MAG: hypothetical protein WD576_04170 [Nitriliruptoraceae bacterium]
MTSRRRIAFAAIAATLVACQAASERDPAANLRPQQVGPVNIEVPSDWRRSDLDTNGLVASAEFTPGSSPGEHVQVIIGCGAADADELVIATVQQPRDGLILVEYSSTVSRFRRAMGRAILDSVSVDDELLASHCSP